MVQRGAVSSNLGHRCAPVTPTAKPPGHGGRCIRRPGLPGSKAKHPPTPPVFLPSDHSAFTTSTSTAATTWIVPSAPGAIDNYRHGLRCTDHSGFRSWGVIILYSLVQVQVGGRGAVLCRVREELGAAD